MEGVTSLIFDHLLLVFSESEHDRAADQTNNTQPTLHFNAAISGKSVFFLFFFKEIIFK